MITKIASFLTAISRLACIMLVIVLAGCTEVLYSKITEKEGNEMLSILLEDGISAEKVPGPKGETVSLMVQKEDLSRAIRVLKSRGYPRDDFASVGELFKKEGLISSPLEERARYIYGLSQGLSATLSQLDGVITARVHVVMPDSENKKAPLEVPSASVFIKYASSVDLEDFVPQIKMLVNNGIEGLKYDNISVALFPTQTTSTPALSSMKNVLSINVSENSAYRLYGVLATAFVLLSLACLGNFLLYRRLGKTDTQSVPVRAD